MGCNGEQRVLCLPGAGTGKEMGVLTALEGGDCTLACLIQFMPR